MLVDERVRQGYTLLEALDATENLRARDAEPEPVAPRAASPQAAPPPNMAALGEFERWNEMRR